jgi:hypothetical protein
MAVNRFLILTLSLQNWNSETHSMFQRSSVLPTSASYESEHFILHLTHHFHLALGTGSMSQESQLRGNPGFQPMELEVN